MADLSYVYHFFSETMMNRYEDRVHIRTTGSGTHYDGRVWYELLTSIRSVNGELISASGGPLDKSRLKPGDRITLEYKSKIYHGVVEIDSTDSPPLRQEQSDSSSSPQLEQPTQANSLSQEAEEPSACSELRVSPRKIKHKTSKCRQQQESPPKKRAKVEKVTKKAGYRVHVYNIHVCSGIILLSVILH